MRVLGEDLTLYSSEAGEYGLIGDRCPHRCMAMKFGVPDPRGLRCGYHAWLFDAQGNCLEQPWEDRTQPELHFRDKIKIKAYPVQELGGLDLRLPRSAAGTRCCRAGTCSCSTTSTARIDIQPIPCNWLQCMDNSFDPLHFEFLHAGFGNYQFKRLGRAARAWRRPSTSTSRSTCSSTASTNAACSKARRWIPRDWTIGHPVIFPFTLSIGDDNPQRLALPRPDRRHAHDARSSTRRGCARRTPRPSR